jgi:hypothetical protein
MPEKVSVPTWPRGLPLPLVANDSVRSGVAALEADPECTVFAVRDHDPSAGMAKELPAKTPTRFTLIGLSAALSPSRSFDGSCGARGVRY